MTVSHRLVTGISAALALSLAACSANGTPGSSMLPGALQNATTPQSMVRLPADGATTGERIYVSSGRQPHGGIVNEIDVYDATAPYRQVATITNGVSGPNGMAVDPSGNLWVSEVGHATIQEFKPGATTPSVTLRQDLINPLTLTFAPNGTMYAVNYHQLGHGSNIFAYAPGSKTPTNKVWMLAGFEGLAVGADGDLYAGVNTATSGVYRFTPDLKHWTDTQIRVGFTGCVAFDNHGNMLVCDQTGAAINVYPPHSHTASSVITTGLRSPYQVAFNPSYTKLFVADNSGDSVLIYSYPQGKLLGSIPRGNSAFGIAFL